MVETVTILGVGRFHWNHASEKETILDEFDSSGGMRGVGVGGVSMPF